MPLVRIALVIATLDLLSHLALVARDREQGIRFAQMRSAAFVAAVSLGHPAGRLENLTKTLTLRLQRHGWTPAPSAAPCSLCCALTLFVELDFVDPNIPVCLRCLGEIDERCTARREAWAEAIANDAGVTFELGEVA